MIIFGFRLYYPYTRCAKFTYNRRVMRYIPVNVRIGFLSLAISLLVVACTSLAPASIPTQVQVVPTPIVSQEVTQEYSSPGMNSSLRFEHLGLESGLSQSVITAILQDSSGFMWFGTEDGLNRYNGYEVEIFRPDPDDPNSLSDRWITALYEDSRGYLWIGTRFGGLNRFDPETGQFIQYKNNPQEVNSLSANNVTALLQDNQGNLWIGTGDGLDRLELRTDTIHHYRANNYAGLNSDSISVLFMDSHDKLWVGTSDNGLNQFDPKTGTFRNYRYDPQNIVRGGIEEINSISNNNIRDIVEDGNGNLWIATASGLNVFDTQLQIFSVYQHSRDNQFSINDNNVSSLFLDKNNGLWVGTNSGLDFHIENSGLFIHYTHNQGDLNSLSNNSIVSIYEDRGNVLWVGTYGGGLNKFNRSQSKFTYYQAEANNPNSLSTDLIYPIFIDRTGIVWIGTYGGGLNRFNPRAELFTHYRHDPEDPGSLLSDEVLSIRKDVEGTLWVGTTFGLSRLASGATKFTHYRHVPQNPYSIANGAVNAILVDGKGDLWLGTSDGLDHFLPSSNIFIHYRHNPDRPESLSSNSVISLYEDHEQNLWVGTLDNGLDRFDRESNKFIHYQNDPENPGSISHNSIMGIYQDLNDVLWVATAGGGLNRYDPQTDSFYHYTEKLGLPNNVVYGILEDRDGNLWLSTNYGLSRFDPELETFRNYTTSDGLQSNEFNMSAYAKSVDGKLYFGGVNGLNSFDPTEVKDNAYTPPIVLTSFTQDGQPVANESRIEYLQTVTLSWPNNNFSFEFAALSFAQSNHNQYAYMLENFDSDWNYIGARRDGRYTNLPGGTYILHLKGSNSDGIWNDNGQSILITVIPPFWQTWTFRILVTLFLIVFGLVVYRFRIHSIQAQNLQLEHLVHERTGALQKRTEELEALYTGDEKIIRAMTLDQVFRAVVEVAVQMLHADRGIVFVWDEKQMQIVPRVSHGFMPESLKVLHYEKGEGMVGRVLETGETLIVPDIDLAALRSDIRAAIVAEGIHSFAHLPIKVNEQTIGVFNISFTRPEAITDDTTRLFTALVQRAALSVENMQLFEQTKELAVVEERNRVARDLHDSAKQKAFAALAQLGTVNGILKKDPSNAWSHLMEAENLVYEVIQELTFLIQEMYPMALKEKGLATTIREYIFEWENRNGVMINLDIQNARRLDLEMEQAIYRMLQEALANVARHSQSDRVDVSLVYDTASVAVTVQDNGLGFDANHRSGGMGLRIIKERAESIGGQACIESEPGCGTKVVITAPLNGHS